MKPTSGIRVIGTTGAHLSCRNKAAKGQTNPRSVVDRSASSKRGRSTRSRLYGTDSGTPPRKRPVTHDRKFRSTVAGANELSRRRRGVAPKTAGARQTLKRDDFEGRLPSTTSGPDWETLKGTKAEERRLGLILQRHSARSSALRDSNEPARTRRLSVRRSNRIRL
jgi:hypothetical protein